MSEYNLGFIQDEIYKDVKNIIDEYISIYGSADRMAQALQLKKLLNGQKTITYAIDDFVNQVCRKRNITNNSKEAFLIIGL